MKYVRHYEQKTIKANDPEEFDILMNMVYREAAKSGKEPEIHFFDSMGFCASVKYYISVNLPETIAEEYELKGLGEKCCACPYFSKLQDKRFKSSLCTCLNRRVYIDSPACDIFYKEFREADNGSN